MNFDFNEEQYQLRDSVRDFLGDRWGVRKARASLGKFDLPLWQGLCDLGLQTLLVPAEYGGSGLGLIDLVLVLEEFGAAMVPAAMADTQLAAEVIGRDGSDGQRSAWLPAIATGAMRIAFAHARGDGAEVQAKTTSSGMTLHGLKIAVPCAEAATHFLVSAADSHGSAGLYLCDAAAVRVRPHRAADPMALLGEVHLDGSPAQALGSVALQRLLRTSAFAAAAQMVGVSATALDMAVAYAKDRKQFGRPIGSFQAVKHKCADMLVALEGARSAAYYASWSLQEDEAAAAQVVSMAKAVCGDACRLICNDALQIHGGVGFTWEFDIHFLLKRGKLLEYQFGDATQHREAVAAAILD
jgi:alkylation response protein AidB-like acyl-CoA dehydrogenase